MNPNHLNPGYLLHHRYSIQKSLGQGGFGITYLAYDQKLDQEVCIKELFIAGNSTRSSNMTVHSQTTGEFSFADFVERFIQEARQLARFNHSYIVRVIDVFEENHTAYTVMEYVEGENLKQLVQRKGALSEQAAMKLLFQLLDAVEEVHNKDMLHRDIKPENILITPKDRVVLIDFGSAREFVEGKTTTQTAMLTPGYAPIEQYSSRAQRGTYTDIYASGATLYYMLTGEKPIAATDRNLEAIQPPHILNNKVSEQISSAVLLAMELKPENRFQSVAEMREAILTPNLQKKKPKVGPSSSQEKPILEQKVTEYMKKRRRWYDSMNLILILAVVFLSLFGIYWISSLRFNVTTEEIDSYETNVVTAPLDLEIEDERRNPSSLELSKSLDIRNKDFPEPYFVCGCDFKDRIDLEILKNQDSASLEIRNYYGAFYSEVQSRFKILGYKLMAVGRSTKGPKWAISNSASLAPTKEVLNLLVSGDMLIFYDITIQNLEDGKKILIKNAGGVIK